MLAAEQVAQIEPKSGEIEEREFAPLSRSASLSGRASLRATEPNSTRWSTPRARSAAARRTLAGTPGITEKRMFGGVAFFLHGNMVAGTASGALLLRVGKDGEAAALRCAAAKRRRARRRLAPRNTRGRW